MEYLESDNASQSQSSSKLARYAGHIKWTGTGFFFLAATSMALLGHTHVSYQLYIYITYVIGALIYLTISVTLKDMPQIALYSIFALVDIVGIITRLT